MKPKRKRQLRIVSIIAIAILLCESYLRIFEKERLKTRVDIDAYIPDSLYGFRYKPNAMQKLVLPSIDKPVKFNNHGFVGPDFEIEKDTTKYRICIVGSSDAHGIKSDGDSNFISILQSHFTKNNYNVEVINCAVDGGKRDIGNMRIIKYEIVNFNPDLILYSPNYPLSKRDVVRDSYRNYMMKYEYSYKDSIDIIRSEIDKIYDSRFLCAVYDYSYSIRAICRFAIQNKDHFISKFINNFITIDWIESYIKKNRLQKNLPSSKLTYTNEESLKIIHEVFQYLKKRNIPLVLYNKNSYPEELNRIKIPIFNLNCNLNKKHSLKHDPHLNQKGHRVVAKAFFQKLQIELDTLETYVKNMTDN